MSEAILRNTLQLFNFAQTCCPHKHGREKWGIIEITVLQHKLGEPTTINREPPCLRQYRYPPKLWKLEEANEGTHLREVGSFYVCRTALLLVVNVSGKRYVP